MIPYIAHAFSKLNPDWETIAARTVDPETTEMLWNDQKTLRFSIGGTSQSIFPQNGLSIVPNYVYQPFSVKNPNWTTIQARDVDPSDEVMLWNKGGIVTFSDGDIGIADEAGIGLADESGVIVVAENGN